MQVQLLAASGINPGSQTFNSPQQGDANSMPFALVLVFDVTAFTGTNAQVQLQFLDTVSGKWINWGAAFTAITATGTYVYVIGSTGIGAAAGGITATLNFPVPPIFRAQVITTTVTNLSYTLSATTTPLIN